MLTKFGSGFQHRKNAVKTAYIPSTKFVTLKCSTEYITLNGHVTCGK